MREVSKTDFNLKDIDVTFQELLMESIEYLDFPMSLE